MTPSSHDASQRCKVIARAAARRRHPVCRLYRFVDAYPKSPNTDHPDGDELAERRKKSAIA